MIHPRAVMLEGDGIRFEPMAPGIFAHEGPDVGRHLESHLQRLGSTVVVS